MNELSEHERGQIIDAIKAGRKIKAIKRYRDATGEGLKEAKDFVEALTRRLHEEMPGQVPRPTGCAGLLLLCLLAIGSVVATWTC